MTRNLYGKKMFIADLLIVSLWALFAWHSNGCGLVMTSYVLIRIALCFELYRKSRWAFSSAVCFALLFICGIFDIPSVKYVFLPISHMIYVAGCLLGLSEGMVDLYGPYADNEDRIILWCLWSTIATWLVITPLVSSIRYKSILSIYRHKRKIWWYIGGVMLFTIAVYLDSLDYAIYFLLVLMAMAPIAYHAIYRHGSMLSYLLSDRIFMMYIVLVITFAAAMLTGFFEIYSIKKYVAFIAPISLYVIILKIRKSASYRTLPAFLLGFAGLLYINVYDRMHEWVLILLSVGGLLSLTSSIMTYRQCKSVFASLALLISSAFVLPIFLLGYNHYANVMNDDVHSFGRNHRGLYMISWNGSVGLRDRYGTIIPPKNQRFYFLDKEETYVAVLQNERPYRTEGYYVYSLKERRVVLTSYIEICDIQRIDDGEFLMIDANGRKFGSFLLPQNHYGIFYKDLEFKPHFSNVETPMQAFIDRLNDGYEIDPGGNLYWEEMKHSNPKAYDLLCKIIAMSGVEYSPANDQTFANAFAIIVQQDSYYKGNINKALKELDEIIYILDAGNQPDLNQYADLCRLMESIRLSISYDGLISYGEIFHDEYIAWHNLMEAVISYYEFVNYHSNSEWYSSKPMDMELAKAEWLKRRCEFANLEKNILKGTSTFACSLDSIKTISDVEEIVSTFHCDYDPDYYHPMYYEIAPALKSWLTARDHIGQTLNEIQAASYREVTKELVSDYVEIVDLLDIGVMHPVFDWDGRFFKYHRRQID